MAGIGQQVTELLTDDIKRDDALRAKFPRIAEEEKKALQELQRVREILKNAGSTIMGQT